MRTLVLTRQDVSRHLEALTLLERLREAHRARGHAPAGSAGASPGPTCIAWGAADGDEAGPERLRLHDSRSGALLAVMDASGLAPLCRGLMAALTADVLSRPDSARVALLGAHTLNSVAVKSLRLVRSLERVRVFDPDPAQAFAFAQRTYHALSVPVRAADSIEEAVADADIVVAALPCLEPVLFPGMLPNGCHVSALVDEAPGCPQLSATLIRQSRFFCDDRVEAVRGGHVGRVGLSEIHIAGELGEVIDGQRPGRQSPEDITLYAADGLSTALGAAAWLVYEGAREDDAVERVDFGG